MRQQLVDDHFLFMSGDPNLKVNKLAALALTAGHILEATGNIICALVVTMVARW